MISIIILLTVLICIAIDYSIRYYRSKLALIKVAEELPGPKSFPLIGNAHQLFFGKYEEFLQRLSKIVNTYPSPFRLWLGNKLLICLTKPEHVKIVLNNRQCLDKSEMYKFMGPFFGMGLLLAPTSMWTIHRKLISPSFTSMLFRDFFRVFVEQSVIFVDKLEKIGGKEIDLLHNIHKCTLDILLNTMMGVKLESQSDKNHEISKTLLRLREIIDHRFQNIYLFNVLNNLSPAGYQQRKIIKTIRSYINEIIQVKRSNIAEAMESENEVTPRRVFLDIVLEAIGKKKTTQMNIQDEMLVMLTGSSDTISATMNFVIFMLANFPEIQEKVYQEQMEIYGTETPKSAPIKLEDLQRMNYLDQVIKETLRLFPVIPVIGRHIEQDIELGEFTLPKDAEIMIGILYIHRNEKYWPNPLTFDPDRFLPSNSANRHPYCYIPFSSGPRNCIGMKYGMMSMKVILATLVRAFVFKVDKFTAIDEIKLNIDFLINTVDPLKVKVEKRNRN